MFRLIFYIILLFAGVETYEHRDEIKHPQVIAQFIQNDITNVFEVFRPAHRIMVQSGAAAQTAPMMTPSRVNAWYVNNYKITPAFSYSLRGAVLGKEHYFMGRETELSAYDLALGWQQMSDPNVISQIDISQSNRWYYYHYNTNPPIQPELIPVQSGNMHIIAGNTNVALALSRIHKGDVISLEGYLVNISAPDGWQWETGTSPSAEGAHGCKVIWVVALTIQK